MGSLAGIAGAVLLAAASLGSIAMAVSRQASRRIGWVLVLAIAVAGVLIAVAGGRIWGAGALLIAATGFWLFDRGVPGNRPRPGWLRAWAVLLVVIAIAVLTLTLAAVRAG